MGKEGYKNCSKCNQELPETSEYFVKASNTKSGLGAMCKRCKHEKYMEKREYYKEKSRRYYQENKDVALAKCREYYLKNKEHKKEYDKRYREKNKDIDKERAKKYYIENKDRIREYYKKYYEENKERIKEVNNEWKINNQDKVKLSRKKRKNKRKELKADLTVQEWDYIKEYFNNSCAYCGAKCELEQEHFIPVTKGGEYTKNNIITACRSCNASKGNRDFDEWYKNKDFYNKDRENKIKQYLMEE